MGTNLGGCCTGLYCSFSLIWYGPPGRVPTPLKTSLYSFKMYSLVMGNLCILPLNCMESVFHFMCGSTGSVVCCACFTLVVSIGVVLCERLNTPLMGGLMVLDQCSVELYGTGGYRL